TSLQELLREADGAPGQGVREVYAEQDRELRQLEGEVRALFKGELARLNEAARKLDLPAVIVPRGPGASRRCVRPAGAEWGSPRFPPGLSHSAPAGLENRPHLPRTQNPPATTTERRGAGVCASGSVALVHERGTASAAGSGEVEGAGAPPPPAGAA